MDMESNQYRDLSKKEVKVLTNEEFLVYCQDHMKWLQSLPDGRHMADTIGDNADFSNIRVTEDELRAFDFVIEGEHYSCVDWHCDDYNGKEIYFGDLIIK